MSLVILRQYTQLIDKAWTIYLGLVDEGEVLFKMPAWIVYNHYKDWSVDRGKKTD